VRGLFLQLQSLKNKKIKKIVTPIFFRVDPFKQGFRHKSGVGINLNAIRICFQVFLKLGDGKLFPLEPVVSSLIKDKKAHIDLQIVNHSDDCSPVQGKCLKISLF
jgi:hypothetical protein